MVQNKQIAFITGITGMVASHMADLLLEKGYKVYGFIRRSSSRNLWRIEHILNDIELVEGDILDKVSLDNALTKIRPDEIYNFASQSFVKSSFDSPVYTADVTGVGVIKLLESAKANCRNARIYQASSSEMFGKVRETPQRETTPFYPRSPYGCAKCFAHYACVNYRESYKMHISCGVAFNHESARRGEEFVTRKITKGVAEIRANSREYITLGNLDTARDWGYSPDFCEAMYLMLQQDKPDDYVIATGRLLTLRYLLEVAFKVVGIKNWRAYIEQDPKFMRPADVITLTGDASKIRKLGWAPRITFEEMIKIMVEEELRHG